MFIFCLVDAEPGHVLVQKTAYCDTHTPADAETRPRLPSLPIIVAPQTTTVPISPDDPHQKVKNARRILAKKRTSVPVISIPTIPPDRYVVPPDRYVYRPSTHYNKFFQANEEEKIEFNK